jgi:hypothetical protein
MAPGGRRRAHLRTDPPLPRRAAVVRPPGCPSHLVRRIPRTTRHWLSEQTEVGQNLPRRRLVRNRRQRLPDQRGSSGPRRAPRRNKLPIDARLEAPILSPESRRSVVAVGEHELCQPYSEHRPSRIAAQDLRRKFQLGPRLADEHGALARCPRLSDELSKLFRPRSATRSTPGEFAHACHRHLGYAKVIGRPAK